MMDGKKDSYKAPPVFPLSREAGRKAKARWDSIAKPLYGLGRLEDMIIKIACIQGTEQVSLAKKAVIVMCADNGIVEEGVTQTDASVTAAVAQNMAKGKASINRMCQRAGAEVIAVDIGIGQPLSVEGLLAEKVACGTRNFLKEPAMTAEETQRALHVGMELVRRAKEQGFRLLATGEMGIGNTTTASALLCGFLALPPEKVVGRGAGLSDEGYLRKLTVVREALCRYPFAEEEPFSYLCAVGGLDIAGLAGVFLGGARYGVPIVIDGIISAAAALCAWKLCPQSVCYMLASHVSREGVQEAVLQTLSLEAVLDAKMALGEGTGAALLFPLLDMALAVYAENDTFSQLNIPAYQSYEGAGEKE